MLGYHLELMLLLQRVVPGHRQVPIFQIEAVSSKLSSCKISTMISLAIYQLFEAEQPSMNTQSQLLYI